MIYILLMALIEVLNHLKYYYKSHNFFHNKHTALQQLFVDYTFLDSNRNPSLTESNITKTFGYKSSFYLSFISDKDSLGNEYLQARKALYKTYQLIKQEQTQVLEQTQAIEQERLELQRSKEELEQQLQGLDSKQRESKLQELQMNY